MYICKYIKTLRSLGPLIWKGDSWVDGLRYKSGLLTEPVLETARRGASMLLSVAYQALTQQPIE